MNGKICFCCRSEKLRLIWGVTSPFFAQRAQLKQPSLVGLYDCSECRARYFDIDVDEVQLQRLYAGYRDEDYFQQRHKYEFWYSRTINNDLGAEQELQHRRKALECSLERAGIENRFNAVLDHGGDRGQMLKTINAKRKAVFEISGLSKDAGIETVSRADASSSDWDLILSCHVLEHVNDPAAYISDIKEIGGSETIYFFELPNEPMQSSFLNGTSLQAKWIGWLCKRPKWLIAFDFLSTGIRVKFGLILPFLFPVLREHLSFYSLKGLKIILQNAGFEILNFEVLKTGHIGVIARKQK